MSLTTEERRRTAGELRTNLARTGHGERRVADALEWTADRLTRTLGVEGADPVDVWLLRDHLVQAVRDAGGEPAPFTVLTDRARVRARTWFALRPAPRGAAAPAAD
ncbi:DUF2316 family protein [Streptomyces sp. NPDC088785]|uniref:DUF2316 family protein n=1 Tax=Streptomyces sp. NPDC088785 TaxID=3365897 RepID=UPI0037FF2742